MAHQLQASTAETAVDRIARYTDQPSLVVRINAQMVTSMPVSLSKSEQLNALFSRIWKECTQLFPDVDYIYYGDKFGAFVGYERLPPEFIKAYARSTAFGAEFKAYEGAPNVQLCAMCPPASAVRPGEKTYYFVDAEGKYLRSYKIQSYDPRMRPWYTDAVKAQGKLVWGGLYNHSSGHTLGMTASKAIMQGAEVLAVVAADFTISYFSEYLKKVTGIIRGEQGFIIDMKSGLLVASSYGIDHVSKIIFLGNKTRRRVQYHWNEVHDISVRSSIRALVDIYIYLPSFGVFVAGLGSVFLCQDRQMIGLHGCRML